MDNKDTQPPTTALDEALKAGPIDPPATPTPAPEPVALPDPEPGAEVVELDDGQRPRAPVGPAAPQDEVVRPGSPFSDPARELQREHLEQDEEGQFMP